MIRTYAKNADRFFNHYGPDDEWRIEYNESANKWCLYAKQPGDAEWELLERTREESSIEEAKERRLASHEFFLQHPKTNGHERVD